MFEYLEPDASGASNLPPSSRRTPQARPERVRHMLYGSLAAIDRTIKILHALGYADPKDWSEPIPTPPSGIEPGQPGESQTELSSGVERPASSGVETWMAILTKTVLIE